jgi:3-hydroxyacyl-CoA dehydrogenase
MQSVTTSQDGEILVLSVNNPPVNALSWHVRQGFRTVSTGV